MNQVADAKMVPASLGGAFQLRLEDVHIFGFIVTTFTCVVMDCLFLSSLFRTLTLPGGPSYALQVQTSTPRTRVAVIHEWILVATDLDTMALFTGGHYYNYWTHDSLLTRRSSV